MLPELVISIFASSYMENFELLIFYIKDIFDIVKLCTFYVMYQNTQKLPPTIFAYLKV